MKDVGGDEFVVREGGIFLPMVSVANGILNKRFLRATKFNTFRSREHDLWENVAISTKTGV